MKLVAKCLMAGFILATTLNACRSKDYFTEEGLVFGSTYRVVYQCNQQMGDSLQLIFNDINNSLSTYSDSSVITKWNNNESGSLSDKHMLSVFDCASDVYVLSHGAFDLTVAPLVKAWGFGTSLRDSITPPLIDSLLQRVGQNKIKVENGQLIKIDKRVRLDVNALAPGYCGDLIAAMFERNGVTNFLIDIGGEIRTNGVNAQTIPWRVGIDKPIDDPTAEHREIETVVSLSGKSLATSGNYRHFYIKDGKKYGHTINPHTGYPASNNVLSASIITDNCMRADALATTIMVLGLDKGLALADSLPDVEAYVIYSDSLGNNRIKFTQGFQSYLSENQ